MAGSEASQRARLRRAARLAAVQALYQMEVSGQGAGAVAREFRAHRFGEDGEPGEFIAADEEFFEDLLKGVVEAQERVDQAAATRLKEGWRLSRLDATLRAILRAGGYELLERPDVPAKVVIDEYVDIAKAFFEAKEAGFVNATLDALARSARPDELGASA
jgi:N utilization substance protein B